MSFKKVFPKTSLKTVDVLAAEGAMNFGCYNIDGKLIPALCFIDKFCDMEWDIQFAWYSPNLKMYIGTTEYELLITEDTMDGATDFALNSTEPSMIESCYDGNNAVIVVGDNAYSAIDTGYTEGLLKVAAHGFVLKNGRYFAIDNENLYKIHWSDEDGIKSWKSGISGAGWTIVQKGYGEILNLIVYRDKIVAVRECGLTFLSAYGTPENYKLSYLERKLPKIYKNTAAVVGADLVFYTEDGMYFYDGNNVKKATFALADEMTKATWASCKDGRYFLCAESKTLKRRAVLVYDATLNSAYIIDFSATTIAAGEMVMAYYDHGEYEFRKGGKYTFKSGEIDFSSKGVKVLKEVILESDKDTKLEVSNGVISRIVGGVRGKFRPNMRGESFKITVTAKQIINGISAVAEVVDGV